MRPWKEYIPKSSQNYITSLMYKYSIECKLSKNRVSKYGDYRICKNGDGLITINKNLNSYEFLFTLVHEIAHHVAIVKFGKRIKSHGKEWKGVFQDLMRTLIEEINVFPDDLKVLLRNHMKNPKSSFSIDIALQKKLSSYSKTYGKEFSLENVRYSETFRYRGKTYKKIDKRRIRYLCIEIESKRKYSFHPLTKVIYGQ